MPTNSKQMMSSLEHGRSELFGFGMIASSIKNQKKELTFNSTFCIFVSVY